MKNFKIRKRLLAILISCNILLTGCSITGEISKEKEESDDSIQISILESNNEESKEEIKEETSIEETSTKESSIEESNIEESSIEESSMEESSMEESIVEEPSIEIEESIIEESNVEESSIEEPSIEESIVEEPSIEESTIEEQEESYTEILTEDSNYIKATTNVRVRTEPNTDSEVFTLLQEGNTLKKLGYVNDWYIVEYNGNKAYVSAYYTEEISEEQIYPDLNISNICYFPYGTTLYSNKELTDKIMDIPSLESGQIIEQDGNTYLLETQGYNGYVKTSSVSIIPQPVVIVDKSDQILRLYKNNQKQMEFPIVSGNEDPNFYHSSGEGLFSIYSKSYNANLVGDTWDVIVNVFMGYNGGEGIHDATWRSYFGGDIYTYDGSHGCINCPYNEALADEVEVGDKVLVKR